MSKILSKQDLVQARDQVLEPVEVPEWGGRVYMRSISARERGQIEAAAAQFQKGKNDSYVRTFSMRLVALSLCDEKGNRLLEENEFELLAQRNAAVIGRLSKVALRLSGFSKEDMEELEKNSSKAEADASPSA